MDLTSLSRDVTLDFTKSLVDRDNADVGEDTTIHFSLAITASRVEREREEEEGDGEGEGEREKHSQQVHGNYVRSKQFPLSSKS